MDRIGDAATLGGSFAVNYHSCSEGHNEGAAAGPLEKKGSRRNPKVFFEEVEVESLKARAGISSDFDGPAQETGDVLGEGGQ